MSKRTLVDTRRRVTSERSKAYDESWGRVVAEAEAAGGKLLKAASETFWGGYSGYFADPDGHPWEVAFNPFWTLDADGGVKLSD